MGLIMDALNRAGDRGVDVTEIIAERGRIYGDPERCHANLGLAITAILQQHYQIDFPEPIPGYVVALIMCAVKTVRASGTVYHPDNYVDLEAYKRFAQQMHEKSALSLDGQHKGG